MRSLSIWASLHVFLARLIIVFGFVGLTVAASIAGFQLKQLSVSLPGAFLSISFIVYFTGFLLYPSKFRHQILSLRWNYRNRKICDVLLSVATFLIVLFLANSDFKQLNNFSLARAASAVTTLPPADSVKTPYQPIGAFIASMKDADGKLLKWKERKKLLKTQIKGIRHSSMKRAERVGLIILSIVVAIGLLFLVASLACSLSCNGSETAAIALGIGGAALVIILLIVTLKNIQRKNRRRQPPPPDSNSGVRIPIPSETLPSRG